MDEKKQKTIVPVVAITFVIVAFLLVIGLFFGGGSKEGTISDLRKEEARISQDLKDAQDNLLRETSQLNDLERAFRALFPFYGIASDEFKNVSNAVSKTDVFFFDANGKPQLKITTKADLQQKINAKRQNINTILSAWKRKVSVSQASTITSATINDLVLDAQEIEEYVNELAQIVDLLTPENSGLSQEEIDAYANLLSQVLSDITGTIATLVVTSTSPQSASPTQTVTVTVSDIENQQAEVDAAQAQVDALAAQLAQIQALIQQAQQQQASSTQQTPVIQHTTQQPQNVGTQRGNYVPPDIIIQPGPPSLIEGENAY